jgi:hypothetical protein
LIDGRDNVDIFSIMPVEVFADDRLTKTDLRVLGAILSFRNKTTNLCCPRREAIAERTGLPICKISTATTHLVELGWLEKSGSGGRSSPSHYEFRLPDRFSNTVTDSVRVSKVKTVTDSVTVTEPVTVTESVTKTVTESVRGKEQTREQKKETPYGVSKKSGEKRGERLSLETLPDDWRRFCLDERPRLNADRVFARFRDYWIAQPGAKGRKLDWSATWRNWVRNENEGGSNATRQQSGEYRKLSLAERAQQDLERLEARERREREFGESVVG